MYRQSKQSHSSADTCSCADAGFLLLYYARSSVAPFLPRNVYPARPTRVFSDEPPRPQSPSQFEDDAGIDNEMEVDEEDEADAEVTEVKILVGGVADGEEQELLTLQRGEARRLGESRFGATPMRPGSTLTD